MHDLLKFGFKKLFGQYNAFSIRDCLVKCSVARHSGLFHIQAMQLCFHIACTFLYRAKT